MRDDLKYEIHLNHVKRKAGPVPSSSQTSPATPTSEIRFEGPPPADRKIKQNPIADALKARPGEWAIVKIGATPSAATSAANYIQSAKSSLYAPKGSFEAVYRLVDGEHRVYARYVGDQGGVA